MVIKEAKSGYDIAKEFAEGVNLFWEASHQQIYKALAMLVDEGCLDIDTIIQKGKPDKKNYFITPKGKELLADWVDQPTKLPTKKIELLIKLLAMEEVGIEPIKNNLLEHYTKMEQKRAIFNSIQTEFFPNDNEYKNSLYLTSKYLALQKGFHMVDGDLAWVEQALTILSELELNPDYALETCYIQK